MPRGIRVSWFGSTIQIFLLNCVAFLRNSSAFSSEFFCFHRKRFFMSRFAGALPSSRPKSVDDSNPTTTFRPAGEPAKAGSPRPGTGHSTGVRSESRSIGHSTQPTRRLLTPTRTVCCAPTDRPKLGCPAGRWVRASAESSCNLQSFDSQQRCGVQGSWRTGRPTFPCFSTLGDRQRTAAAAHPGTGQDRTEQAVGWLVGAIPAVQI